MQLFWFAVAAIACMMIANLFILRFKRLSSGEKDYDEHLALLVLLECSDRRDYSLSRALLIRSMPKHPDENEYALETLVDNEMVECYGDASERRVRLSQRARRELLYRPWRETCEPELVVQLEEGLRFTKAMLSSDELRAARPV